MGNQLATPISAARVAKARTQRFSPAYEQAALRVRDLENLSATVLRQLAHVESEASDDPATERDRQELATWLELGRPVIQRWWGWRERERRWLWTADQVHAAVWDDAA